MTDPFNTHPENSERHPLSDFLTAMVTAYNNGLSPAILALIENLERVADGRVNGVSHFIDYMGAGKVGGAGIIVVKEKFIEGMMGHLVEVTGVPLIDTTVEEYREHESQ